MSESLFKHQNLYSHVRISIHMSESLFTRQNIFSNAKISISHCQNLYFTLPKSLVHIARISISLCQNLYFTLPESLFTCQYLYSHVTISIHMSQSLFTCQNLYSHVTISIHMSESLFTRQNLYSHVRISISHVSISTPQVVMAVAQLYHHCAPRGEVGLVAKSLIRLLRSHPYVPCLYIF